MLLSVKICPKAAISINRWAIPSSYVKWNIDKCQIFHDLSAGKLLQMGGHASP